MPYCSAVRYTVENAQAASMCTLTFYITQCCKVIDVLLLKFAKYVEIAPGSLLRRKLLLCVQDSFGFKLYKVSHAVYI